VSVRGVLALTAVSLLVLGCKSAELTQVVVVVDSDSDDFERVEVRFQGLSHMTPVEIDVREQSLPRRVTLVHDGGPLGPFGVTVSAFEPGADNPVLVEPRMDLYFERGKALMLKVDLLRECIDRCDPGKACLHGLDGPSCVPSDSTAATRLREWDGTVPAIGVGGEEDAGAGGAAGGGAPGSDAGMPDATVAPDAGDAGDSGVTDLPPVMPVPTFTYAPTNFDPLAPVIPADRAAVVLDCGGEPTFDSSDASFSSWCGDEPFATTIEQSDGSEAALLVMDTLAIADGTTLRLVGSRPVILAVYGDAQVFGAIDASASGAVPGAGGDLDCSAGQGEDGEDVPSGELPGSGGGGGGGFGSSGGDGGGSASTPSAGGGSELADLDLSPLRGGCPGGSGGIGDGDAAARGGAGGGALQISASGRLDVSGWITANGGGGEATSVFRDGGGGGGSGGAILLEATAVVFDAAALALANGGGGGGGNPTAGALHATPGLDGARSTASATGGDGPYSAGQGGAGASRALDAEDGEDGGQSLAQGSEAYGAGGGGGGGRGVIRIRQMSTACIASGNFSPLLENECEGACTDCLELPSSECTLLDSGSQQYVHCTDRVDWSDAQASCASVGLSLMEIEDAAEQRFVAGVVGGGYAWLGARDSGTEGDWTWERTGASFWSQDLQEPVGGAYAAWAPMQPGFDSGNQDCMATSRIGWFDYDCADTQHYICER
jgi:hypothetical protein